jgi:transcriptional regulator with XRE-family HTH domain
MLETIYKMSVISTFLKLLLDTPCSCARLSIIWCTVENEVKGQKFSIAVNSAFGAKLRAVRRFRDMSQGELASRVGLSRVSIATLESGKQNIQLGQVFMFAEALNVPVIELTPSLGEVEQRMMPEAIAAKRIASSGALFIEDARALLLQLKKDAYERETSDQAANRTARGGFAGRTRD